MSNLTDLLLLKELTSKIDLLETLFYNDLKHPLFEFYKNAKRGDDIESNEKKENFENALIELRNFFHGKLQLEILNISKETTKWKH